jgi:hypothetical protein
MALRSHDRVMIMMGSNILPPLVQPEYVGGFGWVVVKVDECTPDADAINPVEQGRCNNFEPGGVG